MDDIHAAACRGDLLAVQRMLDFGADVNVAHGSGISLGMTALHGACSDGHVEVARLLLDSGAELDKADMLGSTALQWACHEGPSRGGEAASRQRRGGEQGRQ